MAATHTLVLALAAIFFVAAHAAAPSMKLRTLLQAPAPTPGVNGALFDWGRPCTLVGDPSAVETTGPENAECKSCGSGATATPDPTCTFKPLTFKVGEAIGIYYHSSVHHLYLGDTACTYTTEVCPNATSEATSPTTPCTYTFTTPGSFYISDKAGKGGAEDGEYCTDFGAQLPVTVTTSA